MSIWDTLDTYKKVRADNSRWQGDTSIEDKVIRVNFKKSKKKSSVISTIAHEALHAHHPKWTEAKVRKEEPKLVKRMAPKTKAKLYKKFKP